MLTNSQYIQPHSSTQQQSVHSASQQCSPTVSTLNLPAVLNNSQYIEPHSSTQQQSVHSASQQCSPTVSTFSLTAVLTNSQYIEPNSSAHQQSVHWASLQCSPAVCTLSLTRVLTNGRYIEPHSSAHLKWELSWRCVCAIHYSNFWWGSFNKKRNTFFQFFIHTWRSRNAKWYGFFSFSFTIATVQTTTLRNNGECHYNCSSWNVGHSQTVSTDTVHFIIILCVRNLLLNTTAKCGLCAVLFDTTLGHMFERQVFSSREYLAALLVGIYVSNRLFKISQITNCVWRFILIFYFNTWTVYILLFFVITNKCTINITAVCLCNLHCYMFRHFMSSSDVLQPMPC